jgi:hypothetical protein
MLRASLVALIAPLAAASTVWGAPTAKHDLTPAGQRPTEKYEVTLEAGGKVKLAAEGKRQELPMSVVANLTYLQRPLEGNDKATRQLRHYLKATAAIKVDKGSQQSVLGEKHRLIVAETSGARTTLFCPDASLSREELDLLEVQGTGASFGQLLPEKKVASGEKWKLSDGALTALLGLDAVSFSDVESMLGDVKQDVAHITGGGAVTGAIGGVNTEIELKLKYTFDLKTRRVDWLALLIKEKREIGHVGPGLEIVAKIVLKATPANAPAELSDAKIAKLHMQSEPELLRLSFVSPKSDFELIHPRDWYVTAADNDITVMRLVDRGELVAQCNVAKVKLPAGKDDISLADYQGEVQHALGKNFGQFETAGQTLDSAGRRIYRVVASGEASKLPIHWIYYLICSQNGERISLAFTVESDLMGRFGKADRLLADGLKLGEPAVATAGKPTPAKAKK